MTLAKTRRTVPFGRRLFRDIPVIEVFWNHSGVVVALKENTFLTRPRIRKLVDEFGSPSGGERGVYIDTVRRSALAVSRSISMLYCGSAFYPLERTAPSSGILGAILTEWFRASIKTWRDLVARRSIEIEPGCIAASSIAAGWSERRKPVRPDTAGRPHRGRRASA